MKRHRAIGLPLLKCGECGSALYYPTPAPHLQTQHITAECFKCAVTLRVPLTVIDCEVVEENPHGTQETATGAAPGVNGTRSS